jgi:hypothetical protein
VERLADTLLLDFPAARRLYTISGQIVGAPGGVVVELDGTDRQATTDASGNYSFPNLAAGFDYTVVPAKPDYIFKPRARTVEHLDADAFAGFRAVLRIVLGGRVTDAGGRGVFGVHVSLDGTQQATTMTRPDGTYSFVVTTLGKYTVKPSKEQDYYIFTPASATFLGHKGGRSADFTATLSPSSSPSYVLEFDGTPKTVDYSVSVENNNLFWPPFVDYGHFFWEFWAMPGDDAAGRYMISDGYGGAHAILFGVANLNSSEPGRYQLLGNIWYGAGLTYFGGDQGPAPREWGHFAAGWDGKYIVTYFDGVPVGKTAYTGPRVTPGPAGGCGRLFIRGSDHSNFDGRIAELRGGEEQAALDEAYAALKGDKDRLGEIVFGTNPLLVTPPGARMPTYWGFGDGVFRVHLGDNVESGGRFHSNLWINLFLTDTTITAGGETIVRDGTCLI